LNKGQQFSNEKVRSGATGAGRQGDKNPKYEARNPKQKEQELFSARGGAKARRRKNY